MYKGILPWTFKSELFCIFILTIYEKLSIPDFQWEYTFIFLCIIKHHIIKWKGTWRWMIGFIYMFLHQHLCPCINFIINNIVVCVFFISFCFTIFVEFHGQTKSISYVALVDELQKHKCIYRRWFVTISFFQSLLINFVAIWFL